MCKPERLPSHHWQAALSLSSTPLFHFRPSAFTAVLPRRPFLLRAMFEWVLANDQTPHLLVDTGVDHVQVPEDYVEDGQIILNIRPAAVTNLEMSNEAISFSARFGGRPYAIYVPIEAVVALYARESGDGMAFPPEPFATNDDGSDDDPNNGPGKGPGGLHSVPGKADNAANKGSRPSLKVVK